MRYPLFIELDKEMYGPDNHLIEVYINICLLIILYCGIPIDLVCVCLLCNGVCVMMCYVMI